MDNPAGTQSLSRAINLIKLFDDEHPVLSLAELVSMSGLTRTTVFRMLSGLEFEGLLRKTETGDYALGSELIALGGRAMRSNRLRPIALPFMHELAHKTAESVTIDILWLDEQNQPNSMVIEEVLGQRVLGLSQYIGSRFPAHLTSTGKVLLAFQSPEAFARLVVAEEVVAGLSEVREQGFAFTADELEVGLTAVSAPIFNQHGDAIAALCIGGSSSRIRGEKIVALAGCLKETADKISHKLGHRP